ncbi:unnamed protein product [Tilletia controversa]|uniref:SHSP domain-containing protein n=4 Tax=Tilletia TaxID=13289 RepID=A0A8X7SZC5_9BASI|nr:hypothetical protein CF336_g1758 [Tilletia laevis]KAE8203315.1 hypothetical protein CF328_g1716 [Tilletia controversa]KAE8263973.1 hypothetical protein A4X03_0g1280 [Tilletia caries]KAE8198277.1 hypothetical protein CF336_g1760 [Tilletia laevis]KAE8203321.1 hypothetical protein CF328_g1718 [Tilletia controversa]
MSVFTDTFFHPFARLALPLQDWEDSDETKDTAVSTRPSNWMNASNLFHGPRIDIHEHSDHYSVTAELAGAKRENIKVAIDASTRKLTLSGETRSEYINAPQQDTKTAGADDASKKAQPGTETAAKQAQAEKDVSITKTDGNKQTLDQHHHHGPRPLITERIYGSFSRSFILPKDADVDSENIKGKFDNGVLKLTIPKKETTKRQVRNVTIEDVAE